MPEDNKDNRQKEAESDPIQCEKKNPKNRSETFGGRVFPGSSDHLDGGGFDSYR